jgi:hypothetical protein
VPTPILHQTLNPAQDLPELPYTERLRRFSALYDEAALRLQRRLRKATSRQDRIRARLELGAFITNVRQQLLPESATP